MGVGGYLILGPFSRDYGSNTKFVAPLLMCPPKVHVKSLILTHLWVGVIEIMMCVSLLLFYHLHCLPYGYNYVTKTNTQGNAQLTSLVLKKN